MQGGILPFLSQTYQHRSVNVSAKRTVNMYMENTEGEGKTEYCLIGTPGTETFTRALANNNNIVTIQGSGTIPNIITMVTTNPHQMIPGFVFNVAMTTNYNGINYVVDTIVNGNTITFKSTDVTSNVLNSGGHVLTRGEAPIPNVDLNTGARGLYTTGSGRTFGVFGGEVFEFFSDGSSAKRFDITNTIVNPVSMTDNLFQLILVDSVNMYVMELDTNNVTTVDTFDQAGFKNPVKCKYLNGRVVISNNDSENGNYNKIFWTNLLDAKIIDALSFFTAEQSADKIVSIEVTQGQLVILGERSYEIWRSDENIDLPFSFIGGSGNNIGCMAPSSSSVIMDVVFWLGSSGAGQNQIFALSGSTAQRISNHAIEYLLDKNTGLSYDAIGFNYQQEGHTFYVLSFPTLNKTFVYDLLSQQWHERSTRDRYINTESRWEPLYATFNYNKVIVASDRSPRLFTLDLNRGYEWDGKPIVRLHQTPVYDIEHRMIVHKDLMIDIDTGVGLQAGLPYTIGIQQGQGVDPKLMLSYSDDGGNTWSSERWVSMGKVGQYKKRVRFRMLGKSRERVYRIQISDPVKIVILSGRILYDVMYNP